jgi:hypothetical protein
MVKRECVGFLGYEFEMKYAIKQWWQVDTIRRRIRIYFSPKIGFFPTVPHYNSFFIKLRLVVQRKREKDEKQSWSDRMIWSVQEKWEKLQRFRVRPLLVSLDGVKVIIFLSILWAVKFILFWTGVPHSLTLNFINKKKKKVLIIFRSTKMPLIKKIIKVNFYNFLSKLMNIIILSFESTPNLTPKKNNETTH